MLKYTLKRIAQMILVLFMVVTLVFCLMRMIGDPTKLLLPGKMALWRIWKDCVMTSA